MPETKKGKYPSIRVSIPVSCVSINSGGESLKSSMSLVKEVSQNGVTLELYQETASDLVLLSFLDILRRPLEIKGKVVSSTKIESGAIRFEIAFQGTRSEIIEFAKNIVMAHHRCGQQSETVIDRKQNVRQTSPAIKHGSFF